MKNYTFPTGGSFGRGDSWEGIFEFELTDEEAARLAVAAKGKSRWDFEDDESVSDIYDKVYAAEYENELQNIINSPDFSDIRDEYLYDNDNYEDPEYSEELGAWIRKAYPFTDRELAVKYFEDSSLSICYPEELLGDGEEDE